MKLKGTSDQYGAVAIFLHWASALLIIGLLASGFTASASLDPASKAALLRVHVPAGVLVLLLTLFRLLWWQLADSKPPSMSQEWLLVLAAKTVHILFYVVIIGMAASGIGMLLLSGAANSIFGAAATALPDFWNHLPRIPHGIGARVLVALLILHVGGALYHHFVKRDRIFARMGLGRLEGNREKS
jgi:cytochrome b561